MDIIVTGGEQFIALGRRLRAAGEGELRKEMRKGITQAAKPLQQDVKRRTPEFMPNRYAGVLSKSLRIRTRQNASGVTLTAIAKGKGRNRDVRRLEDGVLRHPTFGRRHARDGRSLFFPQAIIPGFWTKPLKAGAPKIRDAIVQVMNDIADRIGG